MTAAGIADTEYMQRALRLAARGLYTTDPNPRVGCVLVNNAKIVGQGWHERAGEAHAEINALMQAGEKASGATAYVTLEPCSHTGKTPPCADALVQAGVSRVIAAMLDPNPLVSGKGLDMLRQTGIEVQSGLLEEQARQLNPGFIKRMEQALPYVRLKMAMSLDGRTAMSSGESKWISGDAARRDVQFLRARSSAIVTGIDTVLMDDPSMNVRLSASELGITGEVRQPLRVVLDSKHRLSANARIFDNHGEVLVVSSSDSNDDLPCRQIKLASRDDRVDLEQMLKALADLEINEVHVEAGATLAGAMLQQQLADELVIYVAPHLMGDEARGLFSLPGLAAMKDRISLDIVDVRMIGKDLRITAKPVCA